MDHHEMQRMRQIEEMKRQVMVRILSKDAFERLSRVKMVNPELAGQAELYLVQIYQTGKLTGKVTDEQMRGVLKALSDDRKDFSIRRK